MPILIEDSSTANPPAPRNVELLTESLPPILKVYMPILKVYMPDYFMPAQSTLKS